MHMHMSSDRCGFHTYVVLNCSLSVTVGERGSKRVREGASE